MFRPFASLASCSTSRSSVAPLRARTTRPLAARALLFVAALCAGSLTLDADRAHAQSGSPIRPTVVLDFAVPPGSDAILGRKAADALAVELQRSGDYEVATRQAVEEAVRTQPGLRPPYSEATQARLASAVEARSVFSGRILRTLIQPRTARVQIEVRQLDASTLDYINGTQISETAEEKLQATDPDTLIEEALNKAAFAAVRSMRQTRLPQGTVLNVTSNDLDINLGARNGAYVGQRYSVLREIFNKERNFVELLKVGEITVTVVEADQSTAVVTSGITGVKTQDKVRQIFVPSLSASLPPITSNSSSPVTAPPPSSRRARGNIFKRSGAVIGGILALGALVAFGGLGGGSNSDPVIPAPKSIVARPVRSAAGGVGDAATAAIQVNFSDGLPGISSSQDIAGFVIFRGTSPNFATNATTVQDFIPGRQSVYTDVSAVRGRRIITITRGSGTIAQRPRLLVAEAPTDAVPSIVQNADSTVIVTANNPVLPGVQYFYRVARVTGTRSTGTGDDANTITIDPILSNSSAASGGATGIPTLSVDQITTSNNVDAFTVTVPGTLVRGAINQVTVQVSTDSQFRAATTISQVFASRVLNADGDVVLNLGDLRIPDFQPGDDVFVRVGLANSTDSPGATIFSQALQLNAPTGQNSVGSRFLSNVGIARRSGGFNVPRGSSGIGKFGGSRRSPSRIRR